MRVVHSGELREEEMTGALFTGPVKARVALSEEEGAQFNIAYVHFPDGARSRFHRHTTDQVLIVTSGKGVVATEDEQVALSEGDIVHAPAGEKHWHGATAGSAMTHISITAQGSDLELLEES
jgi:quercetin dioxygenase-like cupin family protein